MRKHTREHKNAGGFYTIGIFIYQHLFILCDTVNQLFGSFPSKAGIGDGFTIDTAANLLAAFLDITFNHDTLYKTVNLRVQLTAVHNLFDNAHLLLVLLVRIGVIAVNDTGRVL